MGQPLLPTLADSVQARGTVTCWQDVHMLWQNFSRPEPLTRNIAILQPTGCKGCTAVGEKILMSPQAPLCWGPPTIPQSDMAWLQNINKEKGLAGSPSWSILRYVQGSHFLASFKPGKKAEKTKE